MKDCQVKKIVHKSTNLSQILQGATEHTERAQRVRIVISPEIKYECNHDSLFTYHASRITFHAN